MPSASLTTAPVGSTGPDWSSLAKALQGTLVRPGDSGYATATRLYNPRFDSGTKPAAVASCVSADDVATCVRFAATARVPFALRSGGHSYPGWSTSPGLVVDVSAINRVTVDTAAGVARIGAGSRLANVYATLASKGVGIAAGSCPTVGITGLALGGGVGVLTRAWGLTCDAIRSVDIVTADGKLRTATASSDSDLFWALRGGAGGSFGAVTGFTLAVQPAPTVHTFYLDWSFSHAADVVDAWQRFMPTADRRLTSTCKLLCDPGPGTRTALIAGTWIGSATDLDTQLASLLSTLPTPATDSRHSHTYADAMLLEAGCSGQDASTCLAGALSPTKRQPFAATSSIVAGSLSHNAIAMAVTQANAALEVPDLIEGGVSFDSLGGAVGDLDDEATAFGHRTAFATVQYTATWQSGTTSAAPFDTYVRGFRKAMGLWLGTGAYVNYADAKITDYQTAYWGAAYPRLQQVKRDVDPSELFTFPQAVRPASA